MVTALRDGDWDTVAKEYKRTLDYIDTMPSSIDFLKENIYGLTEGE